MCIDLYVEFMNAGQRAWRSGGVPRRGRGTELHAGCGKLSVSQSALSYTVRRLETRLGVRLLNRTTRSVAPTEGGDRLLRTLRPAFDQIDTELEAVGVLREKPAGTIRITANDHAADTILWPAISKLLPRYPDIKGWRASSTTWCRRI